MIKVTFFVYITSDEIRLATCNASSCNRVISDPEFGCNHKLFPSKALYSLSQQLLIGRILLTICSVTLIHVSSVKEIDPTINSIRDCFQITFFSRTTLQIIMC